MLNIFIFIVLNKFLFSESSTKLNASKEIKFDLEQYKLLKENINPRNLDPDKKNVIISIIKGYSWSLIKPFFISLISANIKNYDLILFVDKLSDDTLNKIKLCGAIIHEIPEKYLDYKDLVKYKWKLYADFLKENKEKYNLVFTPDIRDVIFQKDIFKYFENKKPFIGFTLEDINLRNPVNKHWVKQFCKDNDEYNEIADKQVISGGTIISSVDNFIEFADILWQTLEQFSNFFDQGAINYLIYYKKILNKSVIFMDNNGPIMTICVTKSNKITLDSDNNVLNSKGQVAYIVHQYDRKPDIVRKFNKKYKDDILNKYFELNKINETNKVNEEYKEKINSKKRDKIIRKIILFSFIGISISLITLIKARKFGYCKKTKKIFRKKYSKDRIKIKIKSRKDIDSSLSTSGRNIV